ncbi:MAG: hypothetical protein JWP94_3539 [Mucilaginibacter sp.]|nr:hypothetical protein [Mucilaginibacter sp.]
MNGYNRNISEINLNGFTTIEGVYSPDEIASIISLINSADQSNATFRKNKEIFAIRQFLKEVVGVQQLIFTSRLKRIIERLFGGEYFAVKSIYFDKPEESNWFVAWHQDITIAVDKKVDIDGYGPWTVKSNQFAVQPPVNILENNFTIRIHLDNTDEGNGALRVIPGSHLKKIYRTENIDWENEEERVIKVKAGGIMIMRPLLLHSSNRTTSNAKRRVIHIELSNATLPEPINWVEKANY